MERGLGWQASCTRKRTRGFLFVVVHNVMEPGRKLAGVMHKEEDRPARGEQARRYRMEQ
jgi:hypothetical protein